MDKNRHLEVSSVGGKNKHENYSRQRDNSDETNSSPSLTKLEDILGTLNELQK